MRVMVICGESSGDLLAAELIRSLRETPQFAAAEFFGLYGEACEAHAPPSIFPLSMLSVMGITEVIPKFFKLRRLVSDLVEIASEQKADAIIFVDSFAFTHPIAKRVKQKNLNIKLIRYVAPKLWAWAPGRAKKMRGVYDLIIGLFDFEPDFFAKYNISVRFAGHPAVNRFSTNQDPARVIAFNRQYHFQPEDRIITLLPGSRRSEVRALRKIFFEVAEKIYQKDKNVKFAIVTPEISGEGRAEFTAPFPLTIIAPKDRFMLFSLSHAALAASGTVSLELTVAEVPHVIAYRVSAITAFFARKWIQVPFAALTNIIANEAIIPEFLQEDCTREKILTGFAPYTLAESAQRTQMKKAFQIVKKRLVAVNEPDPSKQAAYYITELYS